MIQFKVHPIPTYSKRSSSLYNSSKCSFIKARSVKANPNAFVQLNYGYFSLSGTCN